MCIRDRAIADVYGVCANVTFPFLAQWLWQQIGSLVEVGKTSPFSSSVPVSYTHLSAAMPARRLSSSGRNICHACRIVRQMDRVTIPSTVERKIVREAIPPPLS